MAESREERFKRRHTKPVKERLSPIHHAGYTARLEGKPCTPPIHLVSEDQARWTDGWDDCAMHDRNSSE